MDEQNDPEAMTLEEGAAAARLASDGQTDSGTAEDAQASGHRPCTDLGNGERLADRHGATLRYVEDRERWLCWSGSHWKRNEGGSVHRAAAETARSIMAEAECLSAEPTFNSKDKEQASLRERMQAHAYTSESKPRLDAMTALGAHIPPISCQADEFDADPWLLCTPTGVLDLRGDGNVTACAPEAMLSRCTRARFDPQAVAPVWTAFLEQIFCGDNELRDWVQRAVGLTLVGVQRDHLFLFCWGDGRNGKSTFLNAILHALGEYGVSLPPGLLIAKQFESHPTELADLEGARMAVGAEVPKGAAWDEVRIKSLTGGDPIRARKMRQDFYEFPATHTFWISGNDKPRIRGTDGGIWRRVRLVPFSAKIAVEDGDLPAKLTAQPEMDGILSWCLDGMREYNAKGLGKCAAVESATACYRESEDIVGQFLTECCNLSPDLTVDKEAMRLALRKWFTDRGYKTPSDRAIKTDFAVRKIEDGQTHGGVRCWRGIVLNERTAAGAPDLGRNDYQGGN